MIPASIRASFAASLLAVCCCPSSSCKTAEDGVTAHAHQSPIHVRGAADAAKAVGLRVRVEGTARDAKLSAAVAAGDLVVFCLDRPAWPDGVNGTEVAVEGVLELTGEFAAVVSPDGAVSQGTDGDVYVIRSCR